MPVMQNLQKICLTPGITSGRISFVETSQQAAIAQVVVRILGKDEVTSSSLVISCNEISPEDLSSGVFLREQ